MVESKLIPLVKYGPKEIIGETSQNKFNFLILIDSQKRIHYQISANNCEGTSYHFQATKEVTIQTLKKRRSSFYAF